MIDLALLVALISTNTEVAMSPRAEAQLGAAVRTASPITRRLDQSAIAAHLRESVTSLEVDETLWTNFVANDDVMIEHFPLGPTRDETVLLHRIDPFELSPRVTSATINKDGSLTEVVIPLPQLDCYLGSLASDPDSHVLLARGPGFIAGYVSTADRTWAISDGRVDHDGPLVSYAMDEVPPGTFEVLPWNCDSIVAPDWSESQGGIAGIEPCRQSRIAVETDVEFLALFGNNQASATAYVGTLFAALVDIYSRDVQLRPGLRSIRWWPNGEDPWTATNTSGQLPEFRTYWESVPTAEERDSALMLSGRGLGGGIAWLNAGCGPYGYAVCANLAGAFPYPLVDNNSANWDIMVAAHELGHNYGAPHTHSYTPPIDGCGSSPQDCSAAVEDRGTIMSYCHICSGGMANINLIFHVASINSITGYLQTTNCPFSTAAQPALAIADRVSTVPGVTTDIDVLANDVRFNCETLSLVSVSSPGAGMTAAVVAGAGPSGRDIVRLTTPPGPSSVVTMNYTMKEASGSHAISTVTVDLTPMRLPENPVGDTPAIETRYYALSAPSVLPNFTALTPYLTTTLSTVNIASTGGVFATSNRADEVGAVFEGWLNIPNSGTWTLFTNSDDGSRLLIGNTVVVSNDGLHGMVEKSGTIDLAAGRHAVRMEFFENGGGAGMIASWSGPGVAKAVIPAAALTHGGSPNRADINHDGSINGIDLTAVLSAWGSTNAAADVDQDGTVGGADLTVLLASWTG